MLSLFNRFLTRMRSTHPILGNKNLLIIVLEFLDGEDLFQVYQVCFAFRTTIQAVPALEIFMLRYTMKESNLAIEKLKNAGGQATVGYKMPSRSLVSFYPYMPIKSRNLAISQQKKE